MRGDLDITLDGVLQLRKKLRVILSAEGRRSMNRAIAKQVTEGVKDHIARASVSRHKVADRLGAPRTGHFENAPGRTELTEVDDKGFEITVRNTPGMKRAFGPVPITPRRVKALTIPLHRISAHKRVADLRSEGHDIVKAGNVLGEYDGTIETVKGKKRKRIRPLYALVKRVVLPEDKGLLPTKRKYEEIASDAAKAWMEIQLL